MNTYAQQLLDALENGELDQVKTLFPQVLANDDDETQFNLAEELYALGFTGYAKRLYQGLAEKYPDEGDVLTALADIAVSDGNNDQALDYLLRIKETSPDYPASLLAMADVYQTQGLYEVAAQKLQRAQELVPDEPVVTFAIGELNFSWGHFVQAAAAYLSLIEAGIPMVADVTIKLRYAASLANAGRYEDAVSVYEEQGDDLPIADRFQLGVLYLQLKENQSAVTQLSAVIEQDKTYTTAYLPLAQAQQAQNQSAQALQTIQSGLAYDEQNEALYALGAQLSLGLGQSELGERYLQQALALDPDNQANILAWSNFLIAADRHEENQAFLSDLDQAGESDPQLYWNLARSQAALEDDAAARENYLLAFRTFQDRPAFLREIAEFFRATAAYEEEQAALTRLVQLEPDDDEAQARLDDLKSGQY